MKQSTAKFFKALQKNVTVLNETVLCSLAKVAKLKPGELSSKNLKSMLV